MFIYFCTDPPFEQASKNDKWFKPLMKGNLEKFWKAHHKSQIYTNEDAKDLLTKMLAFNPAERTDMKGIKDHPWFKGATLKQKELIQEIRDRHRQAEKKRRKDVRKMNDLAQSINPNKPIPGIELAKLELFPENEIEGVYSDIYTTVEGKLKWFDIYNLIEEQVTSEKYKGQAKFDFDKGIVMYIFCEFAY